VICMSHVIEHLHNGDEVIRGLVPKLKEGGIIYIEYPNMNSTRLNIKGNCFFSDDTHVRIFSLREIYNILVGEGLKYVEGGLRRRLISLLFTPFIRRDVVWDILGIADYCVFT
jgi:hypothetical protein